ncbi:MAG: hemolysin family protein [bacterium]
MVFLLKIVSFLFLILLNGVFVSSEIAIVRIRETRLKELSDAGNFRARVAQSLVRNLDAYISAIQLAITMINLALGWLGEPLVSSQLKPVLHALGIESAAVVKSLSIGLGFTIITFLVIVFGELAPKSIAIRRTEGVTLWVALPLRIFHWIFFPAVWLLNTAATGVLRLLRIELADESDLAHSESELLMILSQSARGGLISEQEQKISERALVFTSYPAKKIMTPRNEIVYFSLLDPLSVNLDKARRNNYARYPLCESDLDSVTGMVHIRDALWMMREGRGEDLRTVARELLIVSEEERLERLLKRFRDAHIHLALVVDDTGAVAGLVTLEDVIEQLVGQIQDEFDRETPMLKKLSDRAWEVSGRAPLTLLQQRLGLEFEDTDAVTVSGYLTEKLGRFPAADDELEVDGWRFQVIRMDALKVRTCRVSKIEEEPES